MCASRTKTSKPKSVRPAPPSTIVAAASKIRRPVSSGSKVSIRRPQPAPHTKPTAQHLATPQSIRNPTEINKIFDIARDVAGANNQTHNITRSDAATSETTSENCATWYTEAKDFLAENRITVSTITLDCKLRTPIDVDKFAKNVVLRENEIVSVKFGNRKDRATNRTIVVLKNKKKPSVRNFYNQVTILMKPMNNPERNYINIKVFKNGSLQMTGCKDMDDFSNVVAVLIGVLKRGVDVISSKGTKRHMNFIENPTTVGVYDIRIRMINSNFKLNYKIDRKKLDKLLKRNHSRRTRDKEIGFVECKYEPTSGHSCVNIKFRYNEKDRPSIFVFQTGAIIITGAKNLHQIIQAYHFIHRILERYFDEVRILELNADTVQAEIAAFYRSQQLKATA
ncbi:Transcription (TATA-box-binding) factor TFIID [uncultured virus]|nr:Transcription (TATA-box-binding) factor TFIID [uncultured virus]